MNLKSIYLFVIFIVIIITSLSSQSLSDTILIKEVQITDKRSINGMDANSMIIDSMILKNSEQIDLSSLLSYYSPVFIKSYGPGSVATSSIRGSGASHNQLFWNGLPLNSPMLGQSDLSEIPLFICDEIKIFQGQGNLSEPAGTLGGSIHLNNRTDFINRLNIIAGTGTGSFGWYNGFFKIAAGNSKFQSRLKIYMTSSKNDFPYRDFTSENHEILRLINGEYSLKGLVHEIYYNVNKNNIISLKTWGQSSDRNIPLNAGTSDTISSFPDEFYLSDRLMMIAEWNHEKNNRSLSVKSAYHYNFSSYTDENINLLADNYLSELTQIIDYTNQLSNNIILSTCFIESYCEVQSDNYESGVSRNTFSFSLNAKFSLLKNKMLIVKTGNRIILKDMDLHPLLPVLSVEYKPFIVTDLIFNSSVSGNIHFPTLNDLYWSTGGNPGLLPERCVSAETGLLYGKNSRCTAGINIYRSDYNNLISWTPVSSNLWKPLNIKKVEAEGIEASFSLKVLDRTKTELKIISHYTFTSSKNVKTENDEDNSLNKQLIYIPDHQFNLTLIVNFSGFYMMSNNEFTGRRYITSDNNWYLPAYLLNDYSLGKIINIRNSVLNFNVSLNNAFNNRYFAVVNHPMPGRNFRITLRYEFNK